MNQGKLALPFRRYQMQPVWRGDKPQRGRYREFYQCDADVVGSNSLLNEIDLLSIYDTVFTSLGLSGYHMKVNNRKILTGLAELLGRPDLMLDITIAIDKLDKIGENGVRDELAERGLAIAETNQVMEFISCKELIMKSLIASPSFLKGQKPD